MDMAAAGFDEMKWGNLVQDGEDYGADSGEGEKETYTRHEEPAARLIRNALVDCLAERRALGHEHQKRRDRDRQQEDEPGIGHRILEHSGDRRKTAGFSTAPTFPCGKGWLRSE